MDGQRLVASLIASGALLLLTAGIVTPTGLYQEPDDVARLRIIAEHRVRFLLAQGLWALMLAAPAVGFGLLAPRLDAPPSWLVASGVVAITLGAAAGVTFVVLQTFDPARFWLGGEAVWLSLAGAWLIVGASAAFGPAMILQGTTVAGFMLVAYAVIGAAALVVAAPAFLVVAGFMLVAVAPAVSLWAGAPG